MWTVDNMEALVNTGAFPILGWTPTTQNRVDGTALEVSIGRHLSTAFVVPLPVAMAPRVWNMTQWRKPETVCSN